MNKPATLSDPRLGQSSQMIDKNMSGYIGAQQDYQKATEATASPLPYQTVTGPSAESITTGQNRMGTFEYLARGGIENSAKTLVNRITKERREQEQKAQYEKLLDMGEKGADLLYGDAVSTYGEPIKEWIPPKAFFYDEQTGAFLPHQYARKVAYGIQMFERKQELDAMKAQELEQKQQQEQARVQGLQTVGGIIGGASDQQGAMAGIAGAGLNPGDYKDAVGAIPTAKDAAMTGYYNRMPNSGSGGSGGGKKDPTPQENITALENRKIEYEKLKQNKQKELRDTNVGDPTVDNEILKDIATFDKAISGIQRQIQEEKARMQGMDPKDLPSQKASSLAEALRSSIQNNIPGGYSLDDAGLTVKDEQGNPVAGMYDELVISRVLDMMDQRGLKLPGIPEDGSGRAELIKQSIAEAGLEATIDALEELAQ